MEINQNQTNIPPAGSKSPGFSALQKVEEKQTKENVVELAEAKRLSAAKQAKMEANEAKETKETETKDKDKDLSSAIAQINDHVQLIQRDLMFSVDEESGQDVVTIVDTKNDEVIRQIPSKDMLELARKLNDIVEVDGKVEAVELFSSIA